MQSALTSHHQYPLQHIHRDHNSPTSPESPNSNSSNSENSAYPKDSVRTHTNNASISSVSDITRDANIVNHNINTDNTDNIDNTNNNILNASNNDSNSINDINNTSNNVQFKNYTMINKNSANQSYPTPNNTPIPNITVTNNSNNANSVKIATTINNIFSPDCAKDSNGYPILSREFVVRRISEGETGRLKEELKCESCGKGYKHITSLAKHLWEHTAEWQKTKKLLISKHQQAQLLEAASILCSIGEKPNNTSNVKNIQNSTDIENNDPFSSPTRSSSNSIHSESITPSSSLTTDLNKIHQFTPSYRRKSKSDHSNKASKFGGKRRSKSFVLSDPFTATAAAVAVNALHNSTNSSSQLDNDGNGANQDMKISSRRDSDSMNPPTTLRRGSMLNSRLSISASRRGSLLGSLIREETTKDNNDSLVIYDSDEDE